MTLTQVWGSLLILPLCLLLGGLPLTGWITRVISGQRLAELGTGNVGVSAAFYHGGWTAGILSVLTEAGKGIIAVLLARVFFPNESTWELVALIALVIGRYWIGGGAGTTNVVWGCVVYDWAVALLVFLISSISFTILRERQQGQISVLIIFPLIVALQRQAISETIAAIALSGLLAWIYRRIPDDLDLAPEAGQVESRRMFKFFRGDRAVISLGRPLDPRKVGQKAATLSQLKRWGYPVPQGWVLPAGDDPEPLIELLHPSTTSPFIVRSSAVGEDSEQASAAGQYRTIANVTSRSALMDAIAECQAFYNQPSAARYRQDQGMPADGMAVLVQVQVQSVFSGVAFSRDPTMEDFRAVAIEGLPGEASRVVSGRFTPERYHVAFPEDTDQLDLPIEGEVGDLPPQLIQQVACLARALEARYHGIPQDIEWSYDGRTLWLLQSRPITTLLPIWTRKIAAEVIPGLIRPLSWSVNQPLTCGVWGEIFTLVLGDRAQGLNFSETATLHYSHAYFNASLLSQIFRRMGLPAESLEFLTRGSRMSKPSLRATLRNIPGLLRLIRRELNLEQDFQRDYQQAFLPNLQALAKQSANDLTSLALIQRVDSILEILKQATYYNILAPLSIPLRQALLKVQDQALDNTQTPEVAALESLKAIAEASRPLLAHLDRLTPASPDLFIKLAEAPNGQVVLEQLERFLNRYGYLSQVGTDIAVPTWREDPRPIRNLFASFLFSLPPRSPKLFQSRSLVRRPWGGWATQLVQRRINLKGRVATVYNQLLAELRWSFVALEQIWLRSGLLSESGDIFFLKLSEIRRIIQNSDQSLVEQILQLIAERQSQLERNSQLTSVPPLVYGNPPAVTHLNINEQQSSRQLRGIGASPGQAEGRVRILRNLQATPQIDRNTVLVVPYTDAGWAPLLAQAGGLISEVGGRLSHGAILAREYRIPAVMDVPNATQQLQDGQPVRIDGQRGTVDVLEY